MNDNGARPHTNEGEVNELALFAGAGGGLLASKWLLGWRTVCYVENAEYLVKVIKARIRDGYLDDAPIWDDIKTFDGRPWRGCVDIITAGFPCQPFSTAGKQKGKDDDRNMWPDTVRIIREVRPEWCFLENVPGLLFQGSGYFGTILRDLAEGGYDARWRVLSAAEVGAPHRRARLWIVAHAESKREAATQQSRQLCGVESRREDVADAESFNARVARNLEGREDSDPGSRNSGERTQQRRNEKGQNNWWEIEPDVGRMADGVAARVDRLRALGNGQVPFVAKVAWELLEGAR